MLTNFVYAKSKAMFEERLDMPNEVPDEAIVFIEDTKEIWTHGTYFDCSTLDPNIIPNLQMEIDELKGIVDNKAYTDGSYPNMTVGTAKDLYTVQNSAEFEFSHKISEVESESDIAKIENIKGNSVVWNNLVEGIVEGSQYGYKVSMVDRKVLIQNVSATTPDYGNLAKIRGFKPITGHKYVLLTDNQDIDIAFNSLNGFDGKAHVIVTAPDITYNDIYLRTNSAPSLAILPKGGSLTLRYVICDLTQMFGAGNEPQTIDDFYSRIPQGIDIDAYNEGEVIHMNVDAVKSVGFNQWDEVWEQGQISQTDGSNVASDYHIRSKNFIKVMPGKTYVMVGTFIVIFYDAEKEFVDWWSVGNSREFTLPDNVFYIRLYADGPTYNHDICINISDSEKNGIYEPYISRMQSLEILRKYFPNGMRSAGTAHDEIRYNKAAQKWEAVKRIGEVDMGNQLWQRNSDGRFETSFSSARPSVSVTEVGGVLCSRYVAVSALDTYNGINGISIDNVSKIWVRDSAYTDIVSFKAAMQGVILYYELANPIVTEIEDAFNLDYEVWNGGTEQAIAYVKSAPFKGTIKYGIDSALVTIKNNSLEISNLKNRIISDGDEVSNLTLKPGCKIGSFSVDSSNNLSSSNVILSNKGISVISNDDENLTTIGSFGVQIVSTAETESALYVDAPNGIEITDMSSHLPMKYAIRAHDGVFSGLRPYVRVINNSSSSSDKTLTALDHTILINSSSQQTITLPSAPKDGQEYTIMMSLKDSTSVKNVISSSSINIFVPKEGNLKSSLTVDAHGCIKLIYVKDTGYWGYYRMA